MAKVNLPDKAITYTVATILGSQLMNKGQYNEAKEFYLDALEGRRRVLWEENKGTVMSLYNFGNLLRHTDDYGGALDYYLQAPRVQGKILRKTHPHTLDTITCMAIVYGDGLGDRVKDEEMQRLALDNYEKSLGEEHEDMKHCAFVLAMLLRE